VGWSYTPQQPAHPDIRADEPQLAGALLELQVVHPHHLGAVRVHDLLVEEIASEPEGLRRQRLGCQAIEPVAQPDVRWLDGHLAPGHHALASARPQDPPVDHRELLAREHGDVDQASDLVAAGAEHSPMLDLAQVRHGPKQYDRGVGGGAEPPA